MRLLLTNAAWWGPVLLCVHIGEWRMSMQPPAHGYKGSRVAKRDPRFRGPCTRHVLGRSTQQGGTTNQDRSFVNVTGSWRCMQCVAMPAPTPWISSSHTTLATGCSSAVGETCRWVLVPLMLAVKPPAVWVSRCLCRQQRRPLVRLDTAHWHGHAVDEAGVLI